VYPCIHITAFPTRTATWTAAIHAGHLPTAVFPGEVLAKLSSAFVTVGEYMLQARSLNAEDGAKQGNYEKPELL